MTGCSYGSLTHVALGMFFLIMQVAYFGIVFLTQEKKTKPTVLPGFTLVFKESINTTQRMTVFPQGRATVTTRLLCP